MSGLAILCPGQGSQHPSMFVRMASDPAAIQVLDSATRALGWDPRERVRQASGLYDNRVAQPLICSAVLASWAALRRQLPAPRLFAGYSVGELAAYGCADALSVEQTLSLAAQRAALMDQDASEPQGLLAVRGWESARVRELCRDLGATVAIVNGADHFILGGPVAALERVESAGQEQGGLFMKRLPVSVAAHTPSMRVAGERFRDLLSQSALKAPVTPVVAGINAALVRDRETAVATLAAQLSSAVDWASCVQVAYESGVRVFLELEPGTALAHLARDIIPDVAARSVEEFKTLSGVSDWVSRRLER